MMILKKIIVSMLVLIVSVNCLYAASYLNFYTKDKNFETRKILTTKIIKAKNIDDIINSAKEVLKKEFDYEDNDIKIEKDYGFIVAFKTKKSNKGKQVANAIASVFVGSHLNSARYVSNNVNIKIMNIYDDSYEIRVLFNEITSYDMGSKIDFITKEKVYEKFFNNLFSNMIEG